MKRNLEFFFVDSSSLAERMPDFCKMRLLVSLRQESVRVGWQPAREQPWPHPFTGRLPGSRAKRGSCTRVGYVAPKAETIQSVPLQKKNLPSPVLGQKLPLILSGVYSKTSEIFHCLQN